MQWLENGDMLITKEDAELRVVFRQVGWLDHLNRFYAKPEDEKDLHSGLASITPVYIQVGPD